MLLKLYRLDLAASVLIAYNTIEFTRVQAVPVNHHLEMMTHQSKKGDNSRIELQLV